MLLQNNNLSLKIISSLETKSCIEVLVKVSDWNSFRTNHNYSDICVRTNPRQLIRVNTKKVSNLVWSKSVENLFDSQRRYLRPPSPILIILKYVTVESSLRDFFFLLAEKKFRGGEVKVQVELTLSHRTRQYSGFKVIWYNVSWWEMNFLDSVKQFYGVNHPQTKMKLYKKIVEQGKKSEEI